MQFNQWLLVREEFEGIRGEYWIIDGQVDFADGDVGDKNHEGIAIDAVTSSYADQVVELANELDVDASEVKSYDEVDYEALQQTIHEIELTLIAQQKMTEEQASTYVMQYLGCDQPTYLVLTGFGDAREYAMEHMGWIAVRSNNVELFGYDASRQKEIADGIAEIAYEETGEEPNPAEVELSVFDHKTNKSWYATLEDLDKPEVAVRPQQQLTTTYNPTHRTFSTKKDTEENKYSQPELSKINPWNAAAQKAGIGSELWRGTSESFKNWINSSSSPTSTM